MKEARRSLIVDKASPGCGDRVVIKVGGHEIERLTVEEAQELAKLLAEVAK